MKVEMPAVQTRHNDQEIEAVTRLMREGSSYSQGQELLAFEAEFAACMGAPHALGVANASAALEICALLSGIGPGDEVIIPGHTFVASAVPFGRTGARIVWADIDPETRTLSAETVRRCLTERTRVVVAVHLFGLCAEIEPIAELCREHGIVLVEDCAQAPGAQRGGRNAGTFGDFGCFSFHTHKNLTTLGEGGMLLCRDGGMDTDARKIRWMGNWPIETPREKYWVPAMGDLVSSRPGVWPLNCCLGEIQCAVGRAILHRLEAINASRRSQAQRFIAALSDCPELRFQKVTEPRAHVYHLMAAVVRGINRDALIESLLKDHEVKTLVQYVPLYRTPLFKALGHGEANCPQCDHCFDNMISFPWWTDMPEDVLGYMIDSTRSAVMKLR